jgi:hypothetical protein
VSWTPGRAWPTPASSDCRSAGRDEPGEIIFHRYLLLMGPRKKIAGIFGMANCKLLRLAIRAGNGFLLDAVEVAEDGEDAAVVAFAGG